MTDDVEAAVRAHYDRPELVETILAALRASGADINALTPETLAPVDEFHTAGRKATLKALAMTPLTADMHVLDAGCGIGGAARCIAAEVGCRVTGLDLAPGYVAAARALTELTGQSHACAFETGGVLDMPFADGAFDAATTFHVAMNIADRARFYAELARVVRSGGPLCMFDVMKGPGAGMAYPVPWAASEATSFLKTAAETRALVEAAGFRVTAEENLRDWAVDFFADVLAKTAAKGGPPPLGLHVIVGREAAAARFKTYFGALKAHQVEPVILVAERT